MSAHDVPVLSAEEVAMMRSPAAGEGPNDCDIDSRVVVLCDSHEALRAALPVSPARIAEAQRSADIAHAIHMALHERAGTRCSTAWDVCHERDVAFYLEPRVSQKLAAGETAAPRTWLPIASAPKGSWLDGPNDTRDPAYVAPPHVWLLLPDGQRCVGSADAYYAEGGGGFDGGDYWIEEFSGERVSPTHWMPLPDPPVAAPLASADGDK